MGMKRRTFLKSAGLGLLSAGLSHPSKAEVQPPQGRGSFSLTGHEAQWHHSRIQRPTNVFFISDTHLWHSDEREQPFSQYSARMANAYHQTRHFLTGDGTTPQDAFSATLGLAKTKGADLLILGGDIFSYPSEAAIEWVLQQLADTAIPFVYTAGNHDWHYEGMPGPLRSLRQTWIDKRLRPLYQHGDPLMSATDIHGIRFVVLDNSTNEILPEQLEFFRRSMQTDMPVVLAMHIPLYVPGRSLGFGCGHPDWNAANDRNFELERRERWPVQGHTATTMDFHREAFAAPNIIGIIAGHIHTPSTDVWNGIPQLVAPYNAAGGHLSLAFASESR